MTGTSDHIAGEDRPIESLIVSVEHGVKKAVTTGGK